MKCLTSYITNVGPFLEFLKKAQTVTVFFQLFHWMIAEFPLIPCDDHVEGRKPKSKLKKC